jgi:serine/threonine protein phosphatase PrpC
MSSASQALALSYLRNMKVVQDNEQLEHASSLFFQAMKWLAYDSEDKWKNSAIRFSIGVGLDAGLRRPTNEDYVFADALLRSRLDGTQETVGLFVVADGIGGAVNGQEASRLAVHTFIDSVYPRLLTEEDVYGTAIREIFVEGLREANEAVYQRNQDVLLLGETMGTTIVAVVSVGTESYVAGIGDSRAYLFREGIGLKQLTQDHSLVAIKVSSGEIAPEQVFTHPQRNVIYKALEKGAVEIDEPVSLQLQDGDVLLLCTDGLWEMVRDPQGADIAAILAEKNLSAEEMSERLVQLALAGGGLNNIGGGHDNIGIVVAKAEVKDIAECETLILSSPNQQQNATETMIGTLTNIRRQYGQTDLCVHRKPRL